MVSLVVELFCLEIVFVTLNGQLKGVSVNNTEKIQIRTLCALCPGIHQ